MFFLEKVPRPLLLKVDFSIIFRHVTKNQTKALICNGVTQNTLINTQFKAFLALCVINAKRVFMIWTDHANSWPWENATLKSNVNVVKIIIIGYVVKDHDCYRRAGDVLAGEEYLFDEDDSDADLDQSDKNRAKRASRVVFFTQVAVMKGQ